MTFVIPEGLAPEVHPLAWLVGRWRGDGILGYHGIEESAFTADIEVTSDGGPYLSWRSHWRLIVSPQDPAGLDTPIDPEPVWAAESGWFRIPPHTDPPGSSPVELLLADPTGHVAVYVGRVAGARVELVSDLVARTETGADVSAGRRLFGLVEGDLMWAFDMAAFGQPMQSYASARMQRVTV